MSTGGMAQFRMLKKHWAKDSKIWALDYRNLH